MVQCHIIAGLAVSTRPSGQHRVDDPPRHPENVLGDPLLSSDRLVCHKVQPSTTCLRLPIPGSTSPRSGCSDNVMEGDVCLRISSHSSPAKSYQQDKPRKLPSSAGSSSLAQANLVHTVIRPTSGLPDNATPGPSSVNSASLRSSSSQRESAEPTYVATICEHLQKKGFSRKVAERMSRPQKQSSIAVYQSKWQVFCNWCNRRSLDPCKASIQQLADFFLHLHEDLKLAHETIVGYRAALGHILRLTNDIDLGNDQDISHLLANFARDIRSIKPRIPTWNLAFVLHALREKPFEPLSKASLKLLTLKTVFLIFLASGRRRSEIHSLDFKSTSWSHDWSRVVLKPHLDFVSKTDLAAKPRSAFSSITIPALSEITDDELELTLCPVRALRIYLKRTASFRKGKKQLFISLKKNFGGDIHKNTVSSWIKNTVLLAYKMASSDNQKIHGVKAHDLRGLSASWAFTKNCSLDDLMGACGWKNHTTFTSHYLKDLTLESSDLLHLGPLVVAQSRV